MRLKAVLAAALLACSAAVQAHNFHVGLTEISFNARTGSTEVVHTYTAHDVEASDVTLRHTIEHINGCIELRALQQAKFQSWMAAQPGM